MAVPKSQNNHEGVLGRTRTEQRFGSSGQKCGLNVSVGLEILKTAISKCLEHANHHLRMQNQSGIYAWPFWKCSNPVKQLEMELQTTFHRLPNKCLGEYGHLGATLWDIGVKSNQTDLILHTPEKNV